VCVCVITLSMSRFNIYKIDILAGHCRGKELIIKIDDIEEAQKFIEKFRVEFPELKIVNIVGRPMISLWRQPLNVIEKVLNSDLVSQYPLKKKQLIVKKGYHKGWDDLDPSVRRKLFEASDAWVKKKGYHAYLAAVTNLFCETEPTIQQQQTE
jgi:hypothetical protein